MKVSIKRLIGYILLLALLIFLFTFNRRRVVLFFIVAMFIYLASAVVLFLPSFVLPEIVFKMQEGSQNAGQSNTFLCCLNYKGYYPFTKVKILYSIGHSLEKSDIKLENSYNIFHGQKQYSLDFTFDYCGIYEIKCHKAYIYDFLGIFSKKITGISSAKAVVIPKDIGVRINTAKYILDDEDEFNTDPNAGTDVSEIKELRDYHPGDRLSQVHWKLSTKSEDLIVKEYQKNAGVCVVIACDGFYNSPQEITSYYELLYVFGKNLIKDEIFFEICYFNGEDDDIVNIKIDNLYDLSLTIQNMYFYLRPTTVEELEAYYNRNGSNLKLLCISFDDFDTAKYKIIYQRNSVKIAAPIV